MKTDLLIFTHIQKAGGTTLSRVLKSKYGLWPPTGVTQLDLTMGLHHFHYNQGDLPAARIKALQELSEKERHKVRLIHGHIWYGLHQLFDQSYRYISVIRDPVTRVLSHYNQLYHKEIFPHKEEIRSLEIKEFLERYPVNAFSNYQTKVIAGFDMADIEASTAFETAPSSGQLLSKAQENLANDYEVLITERYDETLVLAGQRLDWRNAYYVKSHVTSAAKRKVSKSALSPELEGLIREMNSLDVELYESANQIVDARIADVGEKFDADLKRHTARNARINKWLAGPIDSGFKLGRKLHVSLAGKKS